MNQKSYLFVFVLLILIVSLACMSAGAIATPTPTAQPIQPTQNNDSLGLKTFSDENNLYQIDVPADWNYSQTTGDNYYVDILLSPDEAAKVENIVYDYGKPFSGTQNGQFALYLLNTFYSTTGKEGDIKVTDDAIMQDGSERLTWASRGGGYSGVSFFEIRGNDRSTFLMFTVYWLDSAEEQYLDTVNAILQSYRVP